MNHVRIEAWWIGVGAIIPTSILKLQLYGYVGGLKHQQIWLVTLCMNLTFKRRLWCQQPISQESVHSSMWVSVKNGYKVKSNLYIATMDDMVNPILQQVYHLFLFGHKTIGAWPIEPYLVLCVTSHSPNPNKFVKIPCNVVFNSPLHLRINGLEGDTSLVFAKKKLDGNSHIPNKRYFHIPHTHEKLFTWLYVWEFKPLVHSTLCFSYKCWWQHP